MSTHTNDDADTLGSIDTFLRQCLENIELDHERQGPGRPRILPAMVL